MSAGGGSGGDELPETEMFFGGSYSDEQWEAVVELATRLGVLERVRRESVHGTRNVLLQALGYSKAFGIENGLMGLVQTYFTSCQRCGATIVLMEAEEGHLAALDQHTVWHAKVEGITPDGRQVSLGGGE